MLDIKLMATSFLVLDTSPVDDLSPLDSWGHESVRDAGSHGDGQATYYLFYDRVLSAAADVGTTQA